MPYEIRKDGPESKPYCVYKKDTDKKLGCHETQKKAGAQIGAIEASEREKESEDSPSPPVQELANMGIVTALIDAMKDTISPLTEMIRPLVAQLAPQPTVEVIEETVEDAEEEQTVVVDVCAVEKSDEVEVEVQIENESQLVIYKQADGHYRWVGTSSTAFIDRDEEIVSIEALEKISKDMHGEFGPLLLWHWPDLFLGTCDFRVQDGVCLVESGLWSDDGIATAIRKEVEKDPQIWGMSIRFLGSLLTVKKDVIFKGRTIKNIWKDILVKERSLLPAVYASNRYSSFSTGGNEMEDTKVEALKQLLGAEIAEQVIASVDSLNAKATEGSDVFKEVETEEVETPTETTSTEPAQEPVQKEEEQVEDGAGINDAILDTLKQMADRLKALEGDLTELKADSTPRAALNVASHSDETVDQEASKQVVAGQLQRSPTLNDMTQTLLGSMRGE